MVSENGGEAEIVVPPTIQALLQSRLDRLGPGERDMIGRGAVEGQVFHRGRVRELAPPAERDDVPDPSPLARPEGADPPGPAHLPRRGGIPLPPPPDPRRRLRLAPQGDPSRAPRGLRRLARQARSARRAGRDRGLPPRARLPQPVRARQRRSSARTSSRGARRRASRGRRAAPRSAVIVSAFCGLCQRAAELLPDGDPQRLELRFASAYPLVTAGRANEAMVAARELESSLDPRFQAFGLLATAMVDAAGGAVRRAARGGAPRHRAQACSRPAGTMSAWHGRDSSRPTCAGCAGRPRWPQRLRSRPRRTPVPRGTTRSPHPCGAGR